jgi:AraC family transcriptional regulator, regulatory protein of adaptative response / methylated-DNA-[protein]-cysteine methyltransferase
VLTTGVFCRPSCAARLPLRQNVRFYLSAEAAAADALRPCRRCHPLQDAPDERLRSVSRWMKEHCEETLSLTDLAQRAGMSPAYFQKRFKLLFGLSPKRWQDGLRTLKLKQHLRTRGNVATATYEAGFGSSSRVYENAADRLGMTPGEYQRGGSGRSIRFTQFETPLGLMMLGATERGICFLQFGASEELLRRELHAEFPSASIEAMGETPHPLYTEWIARINAQIAGQLRHCELPLDLQATAFQMSVWDYLRTIPWGEKRSYGEVAKAIGKPTAFRAVANACAANRVAMLIPCHRVIRNDGLEGGYRWGMERKSKLLAQEAAG